MLGKLHRRVEESRDTGRSYRREPSAWDQVVVLANRAPFRHERAADGRVAVTRSASGLVTALEPLVRTYSGTWVAHASGNADAAVAGDRGGLDVPTGDPRYRMRYVSLPEDHYRGYYYGFANEGLWPLCHALHVAPVFRASDFDMYRMANAEFAAAVAEETTRSSALVLVQDYHFALVPRMLHRRVPSSTIVAFWHIPWPRPRLLRTCPWSNELIDGLLGSDIVGFQTAEDCQNFLGSAESIPGAAVDHAQQRVTYRGRSTRVHAYPVGVDWANPAVRTTPSARSCRDRVYRDLGLSSDIQLGVGVDRLDYTKGIREKFLAIGRLLDQRPDLRGRFVFVQIAEPSRDCLTAYREARTAIINASEGVNAQFGGGSYQPIRLLEAHHEPEDVYRFYRAADLCYVGSLQDGMNLVAKEFVAARDDERGVLILSQNAGAARQLRAALGVNPYAIEQAATVLAQALEMSSAEQTKRMRVLRANVATFDASWWARELVHDAMCSRRRREAVPPADYVGARWTTAQALGPA